MTASVSLTRLNELSIDEFVETFGSIAEHSDWVAARAAASRPFSSRNALICAFQRAVLDAAEQEQTDLLRAHPDLAGRAALAGELTAQSSSEQAGAGLDQLSRDELTRFHTLNDAYHGRFQMPFIVAVRGAGKDAILAAFAQRVGGTMEEERLTALAQVLRIIRFRLEDKVDA